MISNWVTTRTSPSFQTFGQILFHDHPQYIPSAGTRRYPGALCVKSVYGPLQLLARATGERWQSATPELL
jgi:hypothetical protein